ncbi:hypothetical protein Goklo_020599 [Gossypium klotzschianum]|uniref:DUF4283 domain-containing protein n=1 Tax=Gossypium klotzschianum TaxID=34286 RepID=A0A7J8USR4_9ROSI|nr:hypothetical protein [Gossypium klotzschianum]
MDEELTNLNISDDEDAIEGQQIEEEEDGEYELCLVGKAPSFASSLQVPLFFAEFWVQIHNLSGGFTSEGMARQLGDFIGKFMGV